MEKIYKNIEHTVVTRGLARYKITQSQSGTPVVDESTTRSYTCVLTNNDTGSSIATSNVSWVKDEDNGAGGVWITRFSFAYTKTKDLDTGCVSMAIYDEDHTMLYEAKHYAVVYDVKLTQATTSSQA